MRLLLPLVLVAVVVGTLLLTGVVVWVGSTIPPEPDPESLPSRALDEPAADYRRQVEEGRSLTRSVVAQGKLPGLSLAVAVGGEIVWAEGFRWAEQESRTPMTPATKLRIGELSETLTAAAAGLLSQRGLLDLDAPVRRYLPGFPEKPWPLTTRHLLSHTAGLRSHRGEGEIFRRTGCANDAERLAIFTGDPLRSPPGTEVSHSPYGVVLAGAVVAAAAGEPYLDFVRREILAPLGMDATTPDVAGRTGPGSAHLYYPRIMLNPRYGLQDAPTVDLSCVLAAGGFLSVPSDLARLGSAMMEGETLEPATVEELTTPVRLASGEATDRALGWTVRRLPLGPDGALTRVVGQGLGEVVRRRFLSATSGGGQVPGTTASLATVPEHGVAVAVASNVSGAEGVPALALGLAALFLPPQGAAPR
ncbi:MAG: serine hydrolase domain-containing protein [Thermoanaerobaculia bacterium]|nr:serine hydrolase domain-containing protein [Thermoanaerobaculia bacterium]